MKRSIVRISMILLFLIGFAVQLPAGPALAQDGEDTATPTATSTSTSTVTVAATVTPTGTEAPPAEIVRPLVVIESYDISEDVSPGDSFDITVRLKNKGKERASNLIAVFQSESFFPLDTGGVKALVGLDAGKGTDVSQPMIAASELPGEVATVTVSLSYTGQSGAAYTETFTITIGVDTPTYSGSWATATPTPTGTAQPRPQLVISSYKVNVDPLQPGTVFNLDVEIRNLGNGEAKAVTMVIGGSGASVDMTSGTPQPGGVSGGTSDLTNFAPIGTSNLFYLGDIPTGAVFHSAQQLIVNVSTNPGAYPLKISFVYTDGESTRIVDDQVITLLVYSLPQVEVGYYRDPGMFFAGMPNQLPLQVTNLGRLTAVLGTLKVTAANAEVTNNVSLVGALEPGGYFTMDAMVMPMQPGPLDLEVSINYTDNFNQPRTISQVLTVEVGEGGPSMEGQGMPGEGMLPGMEGQGGPMMEGDVKGVDMGMGMQPETFWQKVLRFFKGLIGLNSAQEQPGMEGIPPGMEMEGVPVEGEVPAIRK